MGYDRHTEWMLSQWGIVSKKAHCQSKTLVERIEKESIRPRAQDDTVVRMPDDDIAVLGKHREKGVAWRCGDYWEIIFSVSSHLTGISPPSSQEVRQRTKEEIEDREKSSYWRAAYRAQKQVRRLCNSQRCRYMWTLTFAPPSRQNAEKWSCVPLKLQRDYQTVGRLWKQFLKRWKRSGREPFRWLVVFELHDGKKTSEAKKGTWHLHFATPDYLKWEDVSVLWKHGVVRYDDFCEPKPGKREEAVRNPGAYMSKYIGKHFDVTNKHQKRYRTSRNFERPTKYSLSKFAEKTHNLNYQVVYCQEVHYETEDGKKYTRKTITIKGENNDN